MKFIIILITLISIFTVEATVKDTEIYHTQERNKLGITLKETILQAKESILIFTFSFSDSEIIDALNKKVKEGLKVTVVMDKEHLGAIHVSKDPDIELITRRHGEGHLHHKILVVDSNDIWIGSANFTPSAYNAQENVMVRFTSPELAGYLHHEADVFRLRASRTEHGPIPISLLSQIVYFCLLPHDGFPPLKIEKSINEQSKQLLLEKINQAQSTIQIAMMVWTSNDLSNAIIKAHQRGVKVQVVAPDIGGNLPKLLMAGIDVTVNHSLAFMHNKLMIIDNTTLINGSANWSQSAFTRNDESFVIIEPLSPEQQQILISYWNYLSGK